MPSNHLILCHPLLLLPSIFPSIGVFSSESALRMRWPKFRTFSFNTSPSNEYSGLISFSTDLIQGTDSRFWGQIGAVRNTRKRTSTCTRTLDNQARACCKRDKGKGWRRKPGVRERQEGRSAHCAAGLGGQVSASLGPRRWARGAGAHASRTRPRPVPRLLPTVLLLS